MIYFFGKGEYLWVYTKIKTPTIGKDRSTTQILKYYQNFEYDKSTKKSRIHYKIVGIEKIGFCKRTVQIYNN